VVVVVEPKNGDDPIPCAPLPFGSRPANAATHCSKQKLGKGAAELVWCWPQYKAKHLLSCPLTQSNVCDIVYNNEHDSRKRRQGWSLEFCKGKRGLWEPPRKGDWKWKRPPCDTDSSTCDSRVEQLSRKQENLCVCENTKWQSWSPGFPKGKLVLKVQDRRV